MELKHKHASTTAKALLFLSNLPKCFWQFDTADAMHLINHLSSSYLNNLSPYEVLFDNMLFLSDLKVFGCLAYASTLISHRIKLNLRAKKCIFLGYSYETKGFLLFDIISRNTFLSRNVGFYKDIFTYCHTTTNVSTSSHASPLPVFPDHTDHFIFYYTPSSTQPAQNSSHNTTCTEFISQHTTYIAFNHCLYTTTHPTS